MLTSSTETLGLETFVKRSYNYFNQMVDGDGLPYFNIFLLEPAEAAHDWPDSGDVMPRQLQAAIMARHMIGEAAEIEEVWSKKILSCLDAESGLIIRPGDHDKSICYMSDQALALYALVTKYIDKQDESLAKSIYLMVDTLLEKGRKGEINRGTFETGFIIKSLMTCVRQMHYEPALKLSAILVRALFEDPLLFTPDNFILQGGHMHGTLRSLSGAADYALYVGDPVLYTRIDALFRHAKSMSTRFGFLPEVIGRQDDIIACETCAIMDYLATAVTLANHGHPEYWGDVERMARNHLIESQVQDVSWLVSEPTKADTAQMSYCDIGERMVGGYSGWSSPTHILACKETYVWEGDNLRGKPRAFQNCCGGSGTHAFFIVWKNAARFDNETLSIHMHFDKLLPQAEIRCHQPYQGLTTIALKMTCKVRVRIPEFVAHGEIRAEINGELIPFKLSGNYMDLGERNAGEQLSIVYPISVVEEEVIIGNPGFKSYRYRVSWKGDTVISMEPLGNEDKSGYSDSDKMEVPIYYGTEGPGRLYRREKMAGDELLQPGNIHLDSGCLDLWYFSSGSENL